ncbi:MAG: hypothetical protein GX422_09210 [Deltaproteobacteria bacterium]|nr:hypothetical protein [Deltaproteobacteria bacterium]
MLRSCRSGILPRLPTLAAGCRSYNKAWSDLKAQRLKRNEYNRKQRLASPCAFV